MEKVTDEILKKDHYLLYIYTPFCGTCAVARGMLEKIEKVHQDTIFFEMNASLHPEFMQEHQIESVPCLLIKDGNRIREKVYAFKSTANIYSYLMKYEPSLFAGK
ncbi:thioredoxin family protein [Virgibacillus kekensis]|uniref:Thioredoxin family protein n=1 Tax=Virgibacillus kekensis TaxID=202261 RepID=A0ABV9DKJ2_9BACI